MKIKRQISYSNQSGFALFMVLIVMVVIAFLVISTMQSTTMNSHTSADDSDRQLAVQNAQLGLEEAENQIRGWGEHPERTHDFDCNCTNRLCASRGLKQENMGTDNFKLTCLNTNVLEEVWKRKDSAGNFVALVGPINQDSNYNYAIEYLGRNASKKFLFRITAKGWGKNSFSTSMVQEVIEATMPYLNKDTN